MGKAVEINFCPDATRMSSKKKQSTIGSFFQQKKTNKENLFVDEPPKVAKPAFKTFSAPPVPASSSRPQSTSKPVVSALKTSSTKAAWWVTPPRNSSNLPGSRKRDGDPVASPVAAKKQNSLQQPWQGRVRPLVRPNGMASRATNANQPSVANAMLTDEQKDVMQMIVDRGENVFFTGAAGTGKSHLLRQIVASLRRGRYESEVAITATTGLAAYNIGGQTLHRWSGIRTGEGNVASHVQYIKKNMGGVRDNWRNCRILVIDEVSMLDANLLDKLEEIARLVRGKPQPFGGIQLVLTGDFFQLPPVSKGGSDGAATNLCFEAKCWPTVIARSIVLTRIFRQKDNRLVQMLNSMRTGQLDNEIMAQFKQLERTVQYDDGLEPTELYPVRWQVDMANKTKMQALEGAVFTYNALDSSTFDSSQKLLDQLICHKTLELKIGAQVLLIRNLTDQLINGRRGVIVTFMNDVEWSVLGPFILENKRALQVYNAVLNATADLASGNATSGNDRAVVRAEIEEIEFPDADTRSRFEMALVSPLKTKLPIVDFRFGQIVPIERVDFTAAAGSGVKYSEVTRNQIPLVPSWALSIHKAQGQTLDRLVVDLGKVFEAGQAYVAVSRATSYDRLQIKGFSRDKVRVHPRVADFYKQLEQSN